ncbi:MAG: leucyl/phenylalanyl-tRNA--protein transferase [Gammaproteobacteria bacterium]|nr:leucyl/phenylalanyl-tRNA--protein transferase [Gammaproteobacteria bacterium]
MAWLDPDRIGFPDTDQALTSPNGLLAAGGSLRPEWLIHAYQRGIFPWFEADQPILWWCPDPRMVLFPEELHVSRSLNKLIRNNPFQLSIDEDFAAVITACSEPRLKSEDTWITEELKAAYQTLHALGVAHSVEVWDKDRLAGGLYGVALGKVFFGESMFSRSSNSSKLALVFLVQHLRKWGYELIDCQVATGHLASLGAREIPRREFQVRLTELIGRQTRPAYWPATPIKKTWRFVASNSQ